VAEEFLDGANVVAALQELCGETMAEGMRGNGFLDAGLLRRGADGFLEQAGVGVAAHGLFGLGVYGEARGGEEILPDEFSGSVGVFAGKGVGQPDFAEAIAEVGLVDAADGLDLALEGGDEGIGQDGGAVVFAFAVADDDLMITKVYVLDAQAHAFHQSQSAAVEDLCHKLGDVGHFVDDGHGFLMGEDDGQGFGFFGAEYVWREGDLYLQNVAI